MESDGTRIYKDQERPKLIVAEDVPHLFHSRIQNTGLFVEEEAVALFVLMFWPAKWSLEVPKFVWKASAYSLDFLGVLNGKSIGSSISPSHLVGSASLGLPPLMIEQEYSIHLDNLDTFARQM